METHNMLTVYDYNKLSGGKSAWNITSSSLFDNCKQEHDTSSFYIKSIFEKKQSITGIQIMAAIGSTPVNHFKHEKWQVIFSSNHELSFLNWHSILLIY